MLARDRSLATARHRNNRHDGLAQRRSGQRRVWPRSQRPGTILCHGVKLGQHFIHEHVNTGNAFDFYSAGRNTIATGVIEAVTWPVGFNSPVSALTSN
jgi:hypothetical protein